MGDKKRIGGALFIVLGLLFIVLAWGGHFQSKKVIDKGGRADAKITDKKIERSGRSYKDTGSTDFNVYYTFVTKDGKTMTGRYPIRKETWDSLNTGDSIEVAYDPENPNYNLPAGEGSLVSPGMPMALSVFGLIGVLAGVFLFTGKRPFQRQRIQAAVSTDDKRILRLLEKIKFDYAAVAFGSYKSHVVFSDGCFLEFADSLPPAVDTLRDLFADRLSEDSIRQVLPAEHDGKTGKVQSEKTLAAKRHLTTPTHTCIVDEVYYDYLKMRYPRAEAFCSGPGRPVVFYQDGVLRAAVMPVKG